MTGVSSLVLAVSWFGGCAEVSDENTAGSLRIVGTVKDKNGNPIEGAKILLLGSGIEAVLSTSDGEFRIENVPAGTYNIEVTKNGFTDVLEIIIVDTNEQPTISTITMEEN